ncbi:hypothetical protein [Lactiplantibacillus carotarum]|uniref:hypothetical protein n=1 Tax=Lactiplantibacillus carotarum TaxID=2993456 RepID=UPI00298ED398|nr:hypothetical protein [Lactiplantibacillus carotarum]
MATPVFEIHTDQLAHAYGDVALQVYPGKSSPSRGSTTNNLLILTGGSLAASRIVLKPSRTMVPGTFRSVWSTRTSALAVH